LAHAHARGVVHRDLKPANVLLCGARDLRPGPKLCDFGIAFALEEADTVENISGTLHYMAPEQLTGRERLQGPWTDLYALGCLAWRMLTGEPPFAGRRHMQLAMAHTSLPPPKLVTTTPLPDGFEDWLRMLLAKKPLDRFRYAADAAAALVDLGHPAEYALDEPLRPGIVHPVLQTQALVASDEEETLKTNLTLDWRRPARPRPNLDLVGAGLDLFGLRQPIFTGREAERDLVWEALLKVTRDQRAHGVVLLGAPGTGKTRLATWIAERAAEVGAASVLSARFSGEDADGALRDMLLRRFAAQGLEGEELVTHVQSALDDLRVTNEDLRAQAVALLRGKQLQGASRYVVIRLLLEALSQERPVVLVLDDVHAGLDGVRFARHLQNAQAIRPFPVLMLLCGRSDALDDNPVAPELSALEADPRVERIEVGPLPREPFMELVQDLLGLEPELARVVVDRTAGNPQFAIQVVGDWIHRHLLEPGPEGFTLAPGAPAMLPSTLREVWDHRLDRFLDQRPSDDSAALRVAALLGREVQTAEWLAACTELGVRPSDHLARDLVVRRLASGDDPRVGWAFVHGLLREAVDASIPEEARSRMHLACAHAIADDERRGRHLLRARAFDEAASPLLEGALRALVRADFPRATEIIAEADRALEASSIPPDDRRWGRRLFVACALAQQRSDLDLGDELARRMMREAEQHGWNQERGHALSALGRAALMRWDLPRSLAYFLEAKEICVSEGEVDGELACLRGLAAATIYAGDLDEAEIWVGQMKERLRPEASALIHGGHHLMVATMAQARMRLPEAIDEMRQALRHFERCGDRMGCAAALGTIGSCQRDMGQITEARATYLEATELTQEFGTNLDGILRMGFGLIKCMDGEPVEGLAMIRQERQRLLDSGQLHHLPRCELYLAAALAELGDPSAMVPLERALAGLLAPPVVHTDTAVLLERAAEQLERMGQADVATRARAAAADIWRRLGNTSRADALQ
ncbi:MAG: AAA family ATPase, partial [Myxococcales bacterium]|nr:AAA family ATPase [Myxococcales bacterium]